MLEVSHQRHGEDSWGFCMSGSPTNRTDEVARQIVEVYEHNLQFPKEDRFKDLENDIASAITSAVEAERERCAKVAEHQATICGSSMSRQTTAHDIAFNIRQTPTQEGV